MSLKLGKERLPGGLLLTNYQDDKFRTETVIVRFIMPLERVKTQRCGAVIDILAENCARYPERKLMYKALMRLYGANLGRFCYPAGNHAVMGFAVTSIADRYAYGGEKVTLELAKILLDCIFEPNIKDGLFDSSTCEKVLHDLKTRIRTQKNDRHSYALDRVKQLAFAGEAPSINVSGTLEEAETITNESLVESYTEMLGKAFISVCFCGGGTNTEAQQLVKERFAAFAKDRGYDGEDIDKLRMTSKIRQETQYVTEKAEQSQTKLVMLYKYDHDDSFAMNTAVKLFGGTEFSKLFMNVREKLSLCYYCQSASSVDKNSVIVDSGIGKGNEQKTLDEINRQLELLKKGEFTDEELENTKRCYISQLRSCYDFSADLNSWFFNRFVRGDMMTPAEAEEQVKAVTRERVLKALEALTLDTVYIYEASGKKAESEEEDE